MPFTTTQFLVLFNAQNNSSGDSNGSSTVAGGVTGSPFYSAPARFDFSRYAALQYRAHSPSAGVINLQINVEVSMEDGGYFSRRDSGIAITYSAADYPSSRFALDQNNPSPMLTLSTGGTYVDNTWLMAQLNLPPARFLRLAVTKAAGNAADVTFDAVLLENDA